MGTEVRQAGDPLPGHADALIALHAKKSHASIMAFRQKFPTAKIVLYLTGTDIYGSIPEGCPLSQLSMQTADSIVVSQHASLRSIPQVYQNKSVVVYNSISLPTVEFLPPKPMLFTIASHLRAVKQPLYVIEAMPQISHPIQVNLLGKLIDSGLEQAADICHQRDPRFKWLGEQTYANTVQWMQRSVATINTSLVEGGANAVGESIVLGRPVLATKIEGNVGMLGDDYAGYFPLDAPSVLGELMNRVIDDREFLTHLEKQVSERATMFRREHETEGWLAILRS